MGELEGVWNVFHSQEGGGLCNFLSKKGGGVTFSQYITSSICNVTLLVVIYLWAGGMLPFYRPRSEEDNVLGSVRPSVRLCRVQQRAKKSYYQSRVFVCVSSNRMDAVDRLLIFFCQREAM